MDFTKKTFSVDIPPNSVAGDKFTVDIEGESHTIVVPKNVRPGSKVEIVLNLASRQSSSQKLSESASNVPSSTSSEGKGEYVKSKVLTSGTGTVNADEDAIDGVDIQVSRENNDENTLDMKDVDDELAQLESAITNGKTGSEETDMDLNSPIMVGARKKIETEQQVDPAAEDADLVGEEDKSSGSEERKGWIQKARDAFTTKTSTAESIEKHKMERFKDLHSSISTRRKNVSKTVQLYEHEKWLQENVVKEAQF